MMQRKLVVLGVLSFASFLFTVLPTPTQAVPLDKDEDITLGLRTYANARLGTEKTNSRLIEGADGNVSIDGTWPESPAGHLRQNRYFLEAVFDHKLSRLQKQGVGPFELLNQLPFQLKGLKYRLEFRAEGDGLYDWGPTEYSTAEQFKNLGWSPVSWNPDPSAPPQDCPLPPNVVDYACRRVIDPLVERRKLRRLGVDRERLYQAYIEASVGDMYMRLGRQVWAWGETDGFRLLDQINPVDSSFGGFLTSLDERRVPIDMLRLEYRVGDFGPISELSVHLYGASSRQVAFNPGTPAGSPWTLPNLGSPSTTTDSIKLDPSRTIKNMRGGTRLYWNMLGATFSLAHYYTYFDTPALQIKTRPRFPLQTFDNAYGAQAIQSAPTVQVSGGSTTFPIEKLYTVVRSEFAYFKDEPRFRQSRIDPFVFHGIGDSHATFPTTGGRGLGDSINYVLGFDVNQYIRPLNPYQTFFFSTQVFYKHLIAATPRGSTPLGAGVYDGEVLPVPEKNLDVPGAGARLEPLFVRNPTDQILQTLFIGTSYHSGQINPGVTFFYDWSGSFVGAPEVTFTRDPWRLRFEYDYLYASTLKGASGVSLLRDRDNFLMQFEYSI